MSILQADQLCVHYDGTYVLWDVSFSIPPNKIVAIIGPNGAGKSTLLKSALQIVKPFSGVIRFKDLKANIAYVPQTQSIDWDFPITVLDVVLMGGYSRIGYWKKISSDERKKAFSILEELGIDKFYARQINQLSGGQKQRLFFARALFQNADIFLLDEPFSAVDLSTRKELINCLERLKNKGKSIFVVHHDLSILRPHFDWAIMLNTRLIASGPVDEVLSEKNMRETFGSNLSLFDEANILSSLQQKGLM